QMSQRIDSVERQVRKIPQTPAPIYTPPPTREDPPRQPGREPVQTAAPHRPSQPAADINLSMTANNWTDRTPHKQGYFIPAGCFLYDSNVIDHKRKITALDIPFYQKKILSENRLLTCLFAGPIPTKSQALQTLKILQENHISLEVTIVRYHTR
ncbi:MAG: hypothetical protein HQL72_15515, partial [Magnetococcales bacterium]|nr:hypothetical protein [Magnetococcales bacterium]